MKWRDYAKRIISPCLDFEQNILEAYHCGRATRNAAKFTGSYNSIKLKLCLSILEGAEQRQRQGLYSSTEAFWPELFTAEAYGGFARTLQPPNPQS